MLNSKWGYKRPHKKTKLADRACHVVKKAGHGFVKKETAISKQNGGDVEVDQLALLVGLNVSLANTSIALPINILAGVAGTGGSIIKEKGPGSVFDNDEADAEFDAEVDIGLL